MAKEVMLVGEPMGLFIAQSEGRLEDVTGYSMAIAGAEFNVAVGLARLGHPVSYLTRLGDDPFGRRIVHALEENCIGSELVDWARDRSTGFMLKSKVQAGDPEIFYFRKGSAASALSTEQIDRADFSGYRMVHLTGILPALSPAARAAAFRLIDRAREHRMTVSFDPNLRPQLWESREAMVETVNALAARADYVFPGESEGGILCGSSDPEVISDFYLNLGAKAVVTKVGGRGAYLAEPGRRALIPGFRVERVVDTVGAGDGFAAGIISALMEGRTLDEAVRRGNAVGAIQVMSVGDNDGLPTRAELAAFMGVSEL